MRRSIDSAGLLSISTLCLLAVACTPSSRVATRHGIPPRARTHKQSKPDDVLARIIKRVRDRSPKIRAQAVMALRCRGPRAVSALIGALADRGWALGERLFTDGWHPIGLLSSDSLECIGAPAIPALVTALKDPRAQVRLYSARALRRIRYSIRRKRDRALRVRALIGASYDAAPLVRAEAIRWTSLRQDVVARQVALLTDPDPRVRAVAANRVAFIVQNPNLARPVAKAALQAFAPGRSIADFSRPDTCNRSATPLRCRLRHRNPQVRGDAIPRARRLRRVSDLVTLLGDPFGHTISGGCVSDTQTVGQRAGDGLAELGALAVPLVTRALRTGTDRAKRNAAAGLARMLALGTPAKLGNQWRLAVVALQAATRSRNPTLVAAAIGQAIHDPILLKRQIQLLRDESEQVRVAAWKALDALSLSKTHQGT
jgi:hypothetical protein